MPGREASDDRRTAWAPQLGRGVGHHGRPRQPQGQTETRIETQEGVKTSSELHGAGELPQGTGRTGELRKRPGPVCRRGWHARGCQDDPGLQGPN